MAVENKTGQIKDLGEFLKVAQLDPAFFILGIWGLATIERKDQFIRGKTLTQHQSLLVEQVRKAVNGEAGWMISVRSGHGVGKSSICAMLILWFLYCFPKSQIATTAPTADLLRDILWKELSFWKSKMPESIGVMCEISDGYARMKEAPAEWFARARTASKDKPEALAGIHGDYVMLLGDEASGVLEEAYNSSQGALTGPFKLFILISNPTRLTGYFYNTHKKFENRERLHFNSEDSPIVDEDFLQKIISEKGKKSEEYKIRVLGEFPDEEGVDEKGYVPLLLAKQLNEVDRLDFEPEVIGLDIAGMGTDETIWVGRRREQARILAREKVSTSRGIASKTREIAERYRINSTDIFIDFFGIGGDVGVELAKLGMYVNCVNVGDQARDEEYLNLRAELYRALRQRCIKGGMLEGIGKREDILLNKYKRAAISSKIQMMSKQDLKKLYGKSPDVSDALMLTMLKRDVSDSPQIVPIDQSTWQDKDTWSSRVKMYNGIIVSDNIY